MKLIGAEQCLRPCGVDAGREKYIIWGCGKVRDFTKYF